MENKSQNKVMLKRMLFLELTGVAGMILAIAAIALLTYLQILKPESLVLPGLGMLVIFVFIVLSIRYTRRDIHKIHELHNRPFYSIGRWVVYALGVGGVIYGFVMILSKTSGIEAIVEGEIIMVLGIMVMYYTYMLGYIIVNEHLRHEKPNFWDIFWVIIFPIMLISGSAYYVLSKPADTSTTGEPDFKMAPAAIIAEFEKNDTMARSKYVGKSILFSGRVVEVGGDSAKLFKLESGAAGYTVNCGFDKSLRDSVSGIVVGDSIVLQCSCSGLVKPDDEESLLSDKSLEMTRCSLVKQIHAKVSVGTDIEVPVKRDSTNKK